MADVPQGYLCCKSLLCANVTPGFPVHQRRQGEASRMECEKMEKESGRVEKASEGGCHAEKASHSCVKPNQAQSASLWRNVPTDCVFSIYLKLKLLHAHCCIPLSSALKASSGVDEKLIQVAPGKLWVTCASNVHTSTNFSTNCCKGMTAMLIYMPAFILCWPGFKVKYTEHIVRMMQLSNLRTQKRNIANILPGIKIPFSGHAQPFLSLRIWI